VLKNLLMLPSIIVFVGSGIGGTARHLLNGWIARVVGTEFPLGILLINVIGSSAMGLVAGWFAFKGHAAQEVRLFLTTGILGGFTTFSAFSLDAALLYERGQPWLAVTYVLASVTLSIAGLFGGMWAIRTLT
jgi:fluoride exporter